MNTNHKHQPEGLEAVLREVSPEEAARLREVWELTGADDPTDFPDPETLERAWQRLETALAGRERPVGRARRADRRPRPGRRAYSLRRVAWPAGAVGLLVLMLGALGLFLWRQPVVRRAAPGERLAVVMPDGSQVELNSGSSLRYRRFLGAVRAVDLVGEAFFEVEEGRPFVVHTFNAQVQVTGTRFNVRAWPLDEERSTTVALESGRVLLAPAAHPDRSVSLLPGQTRRLVTRVEASEAVDTVAVTVEEATAWRRGDLLFKDERLGAILDDVERRFSVVVQVQPASLRQRRLSLALRRPADAEAVVRDLAAGLGLYYRETSNGFEVYARSP